MTLKPEPTDKELIERLILIADDREKTREKIYVVTKTLALSEQMQAMRGVDDEIKGYLGAISDRDLAFTFAIWNAGRLPGVMKTLSDYTPDEGIPSWQDYVRDMIVGSINLPQLLRVGAERFVK